MKPTHKHKAGFQDRVYHLDASGLIYVKLRDNPWKVSAWEYNKLFCDVMVKINTFKGNK